MSGPRIVRQPHPSGRPDASGFCALCAADIAGTPRQAPLGKAGALVNICEACDTEPAREKRGPDYNYEPTGGLPSAGQIGKALRRVQDKASYDANTALGVRGGMKPSPALSEAERTLRDYDRETARRIRTGASQVRRRERTPVESGRRGAKLGGQEQARRARERKAKTWCRKCGRVGMECTCGV